jgi:hypothetical protein
MISLILASLIVIIAGLVISQATSEKKLLPYIFAIMMLLMIVSFFKEPTLQEKCHAYANNISPGAEKECDFYFNEKIQGCTYSAMTCHITGSIIINEVDQSKIQIPLSNKLANVLMMFMYCLFVSLLALVSKGETEESMKETKWTVIIMTIAISILFILIV